MDVAENRTPKLLAIDDSTLVHRLLKVRLKHERLEIHAVGSGREGIELALLLEPEVILLDVDLPDISGFEVLRELKADPRTHDVPVIFLSGSADTTSKVRGLEMGAIDFVTKPFEIAELKARVRSAVRIRSLIRMLAQRAQIDGLTGLWNRAYFNSRLEQEVSESVRHGAPLSLVLADLDHFKQVNDQHGHPFGDLALEEFARLLQQGRSGDIACRYGGEEFAIIMPHTAAPEAARCAERLSHLLRQQQWEGQARLRITASFGVADMQRAAVPDSRALLEAADEALYEAKSAGRDSVRVAPPQSGSKPRLSA